MTGAAQMRTAREERGRRRLLLLNQPGPHRVRGACDSRAGRRPCPHSQPFRAGPGTRHRGEGGGASAWTHVFFLRYLLFPTCPLTRLFRGCARRPNHRPCACEGPCGMQALQQPVHSLLPENRLPFPSAQSKRTREDKGSLPHFAWYP